MFPNMSQQQILAARSNPALGNAAINWLAQRNAADLQAAGVTPSGQSLGISHYLGSGAAAKIMQAADTEPVRNFVSEAAVRANPELANMTVGQMKQRYAGTPNPSFMAATTTTTPAGDGRYTVASTVPVPPPTGGTGGVVAGTGAPAVPAAPAATTAAVPGATPAPAPAAPAAAVPGLLQLGADGLTDQQRRQNAALFATGRVSPADQVELQQKQAQQNFTHNNTVETAARAARGEARQEDTAARTAANEAERIRLAREDARRADAKAAREEADAAQKAKLAGLPYQGSAIEAQDANILLGGDDGSARYAGAYARAAAPRVNADGSSVTPNMVAYDKPTWRGGKGQVSEDGAPDYSTPKTTPPTIMNTEQSRIGAFADSLIRSNPVINETEDAAVTWAQRARTKAGDFVGFNINSPEAQKFRAAKERFLNGVLRPESGAAVHDDEWVRAERIYFPMPGDDASTIELKRKFREAKIAETVKQAGPAYKPPPAATSIRPPITSFDK